MTELGAVRLVVLAAASALLRSAPGLAQPAKWIGAAPETSALELALSWKCGRSTYRAEITHDGRGDASVATLVLTRGRDTQQIEGLAIALRPFASVLDVRPECSVTSRVASRLIDAEAEARAEAAEGVAAFLGEKYADNPEYRDALLAQLNGDAGGAEADERPEGGDTSSAGGDDETVAEAAREEAGYSFSANDAALTIIGRPKGASREFSDLKQALVRIKDGEIVFNALIPFVGSGDKDAQ